MNLKLSCHYDLFGMNILTHHRVLSGFVWDQSISTSLGAETLSCLQATFHNLLAGLNEEEVSIEKCLVFSPAKAGI